MREINSRLMLIMPFLFIPTASFIKTTIQWVTELADEVSVLIFLTRGLGQSDMGL